MKNLILVSLVLFTHCISMVSYAKRGELVGVKKTLTPENKNYKDFKGNTGLIYAVINKNVEMVNFILTMKPDINFAGENEKTPLMFSAENGTLEIAKILIENKANIESKDKHGYTPLFHASINNQLEIVKFLIQNKANINEIDNYGRTALNLAENFNHTEVINAFNINPKKEEPKIDPKFSYSITLKNGTIIKNVQITASKDSITATTLEGQVTKYDKKDVISVEKK